MRPLWRHALRDAHCPDGSGQWHLSHALEGYLAETVDASAFSIEFEAWLINRRYDDESWLRRTYPDFYLGHYVPLYASSLQRAILCVAPAAERVVLRVLDVGVGMGTTALAVSDLLNTARLSGLEPSLDVHLTCIERDDQKVERARATATGFLEKLEEDVVARLHGAFRDRDAWRLGDVIDFESLLEGDRFDLIILGNVLFELGRQDDGARRRAVGAALADALSAGGCVIATEPGYDGGDAFAASICTFKADVPSEDMVCLGPCKEVIDKCEPVRIAECKSCLPFVLQWPEYYVTLTSPLQAPHRTVRSVWVAFGTKGQTDELELCLDCLETNRDAGLLAADRFSRLYLEEQIAYVIIECVAVMEDSGIAVGRAKMTDILRGKPSRFILENGYDVNPAFGRLEFLKLGELRYALEGLIDDGLLKVGLAGDYELPVLLVTAAGREVLSYCRRHRARLPWRLDLKQMPDYDEVLLQTLRDVRWQLAMAEEVRPYQVVNDRTLFELAVHAPASLEELQQLRGWGSVKAERYGDAFIEAILCHQG